MPATAKKPAAAAAPPDPGADPQVKELTTQVDLLLQVSTNYLIRDDGEYQVAALELQRVKSQQKRLDDLRRSMTRPLDAAKKAIMDFFRGPEQKLAQAELGIKRSMLGWQKEIERKGREEQQRADEAARRERERLADQARKAEAAGRTEKAARLEQQASTVTAPVVSIAPPKVSGVQTRDVWQFAIEDESKLPREYLSKDEQKIRRVVAALKGDTNIPGVRVWCEKTIAAAGQ